MQWNMIHNQSDGKRPEEDFRPGRVLMRSAQTLSIVGVFCALFSGGLAGILLGVVGMVLSYLAKWRGYDKMGVVLSLVLAVIAMIAGFVVLIMGGAGTAG